MFLSRHLHLIICTLFCASEFDPTQNVRLVHTLHVQRTQSWGFHVIEAHPDEWYGESGSAFVEGDGGDDELKLAEADGEGEETVAAEEVKFIAARDHFRRQSYAKATLAGVRDYRQKSKESQEFASASSPMKSMRLVCYYNIPSMYDLPYAVFPEQIPPRLCTHIIIGFARVLNSTLVPSGCRDVEFYARVINLKEQNPDLKVMLAVGGANDGSKYSAEFATMVKSADARARFVNQSTTFLKAHNLDGMEIDWEFPAFEGPREQRDQLTALLTELQASFVSRSLELNESKLLLSAAVPAIKLVIDLGFDIPGVANAVDFIDLMCYDYHHFSLMTPLTGPNSPLYNDSSEIGFFATLNMAWSTKYWYQNGMPANKIVVGMPTYGHSYELADSRYHGYYSVAKGVGSSGSNGFVPYASVCEFLKNGTSLVLGNRTREPYAYRNKEWVSFDDEKSAKEKAEYVKSMQFGGMMFYSLNSDDAWMLCKSSKSVFPIIQSARDRLLGLD